VPKDEVVFKSDSITHVMRLMAIYRIAKSQHRAVVEAADKAFSAALAVIEAQKP
jgi:hypothetical protein